MRTTPESITDHPHARGDSCPQPWTTSAVSGSPPRPWGQLRHPLHEQGGFSDHPHARGDSPASRERGILWYGSPPRPWGQRVLQKLHTHGLPDHPHARGDSQGHSAGFVGVSGSPPRPWGQLGWLSGGTPVKRITPTPVGTAPKPPSSICRRTDHPHARGDSDFKRQMQAVEVGSPPRPWGQRLQRVALGF